MRMYSTFMRMKNISTVLEILHIFSLQISKTQSNFEVYKRKFDF